MRSNAQFVFHESSRSQPDDILVPGWDREHRGPLRERTIVLPRTGQTFRIVQPADIDRLLDLAANDPEENLPYWAELWPSGIALADAVLLDPRRVHDTPVIELGCGLGLTAAAALQAGARLLATDYDPAALLLTRWNCRCNVGREPMVMQLNWRRPSAEFFALVGSTGVPLVLAADVLYEQRDIEPLLSLIDRILAPGGLLWLAEPGRQTAAVFVQRLLDRGWSDETDQWTGPWPDSSDSKVTVSVHRLQRPHIPRPAG